jgi:uncharacterized protein (TIGR00251 family)
MLDVQENTAGLLVPIRAHAGARKNAILGERQGALRVAVTAPADKGRANTAIVALLADVLGVSKSSVQIVAGTTSPMKRVQIDCDDPRTMREALEKLAASDKSQ